MQPNEKMLPPRRSDKHYFRSKIRFKKGIVVFEYYLDPESEFYRLRSMIHNCSGVESITLIVLGDCFYYHIIVLLWQ